MFKSMKKGIVIIIAILICSCGDQNTDDSDAKHKLVGEWRNVSVKVTMDVANASDSSKVFEANKQNWVEKLGIQPIRTMYREDGSYVSRYYSPDDSLLRENSGKWEIKNDSLYMHQTDPDSVTYISAFSVQNDTARFEMTLDWDQDGLKDDHYVGVQYKHQE